MPVTQAELGGAARVVRGDDEVELIRDVRCPLAAQASGTRGPTAFSTHSAVGRFRPHSMTSAGERDGPRTRASSRRPRVAAAGAYDSVHWRDDVWKGRVSGNRRRRGDRHRGPFQGLRARSRRPAHALVAWPYPLGSGAWTSAKSRYADSMTLRSRIARSLKRAPTFRAVSQN
jgi:hypothetical protein